MPRAASVTHINRNYTGHATISRTDLRPIIQRITFVLKYGSRYLIGFVLEMLGNRKEDLFVKCVLTS